MPAKRIRRFVSGVAIPALLALGGGCSVLDVQLTSTPSTVASGEPVTFDIKLTNRSQCPIQRAGAFLIAFVAAEDFFETTVGAEVPDNAPPEVLAFIEELRRFFDDLCEGGNPTLPTPPNLSTACNRGDGEIVCTMSGPLPANDGNTGGMTFAGLGDRLQCSTDGGTMSCQLRIPLGTAAAAAEGATAAAATKALTCVDAGELELDSTETGADVLCFIGSPTSLQGLGPAEMASGQIVLPARGAGVVRNLLIGFAVDDDDIGVCSNSKEPCELSDPNACLGGSCEPGICSGGVNDGAGCDPATATTDCGMGVTCTRCDALAQGLPIDCTTTVIGVRGAPAASPWGLISMAALLLVFGAVWLHLRRGQRA
ncbi:MAG: hypothetical protein AB7V27_08665 [Candidatus Binatia bacterium]